MTKEEAKKEICKIFEPAFANYIITALKKDATVSDGCEDAVSRKAMLDYQQYLHGKMSNEENYKLWEFIKALPPVAPTHKKGKWMKHEDSNSVYYDCSLCGCLAPCTETANSFIWKLSNYCPDCGAEMEREKEPMYHIFPGNPIPAFVLKANQNHKEKKL